MIVTAGYNIGGPEVEGALLLHQAVADCAVIGAPDEERGQIIKAFVVLKPGQSQVRNDVGVAGFRQARDRAVRISRLSTCRPYLERRPVSCSASGCASRSRTNRKPANERRRSRHWFARVFAACRLGRTEGLRQRRRSDRAYRVRRGTDRLEPFPAARERRFRRPGTSRSPTLWRCSPKLVRGRSMSPG